MSKFINPFTDVGFKRIFGQEMSKPILITFLNTLLEGEYHIIDLKYLDKEQLGIADDDRSLIYDIYCEVEGGGHIIVEMQNKSQPFFKNRSIYYISRSITMQGERGAEWNYDVKATILVAFLNFRQKDISSDFRTDVALMDMRRKTPFSDRMRLIYLQLPLFQKELEDCENVFEQMIYVLKNMDVLQRMPELLQNAVFQKIANIAEIAALSHEERVRYDSSIRHFRDTIAVMDGQFQEGMEKGMEQGMKQGMEQGMKQGMEQGMEQGMKKGMKQGMEKGMESANIANARKMKAKGFNIEDISDITGLTSEQIEQL